MSFSADTFAGIGSGDLGGRTASDGGTWTARDGSGGIAGNGAGAITAGASSTSARFGYYHSAVPASADYSVSATIVGTNNTKSTLAVAARMNTAAQEQYHAYWLGGSGWSLFKRVGGTDTQLGSSSNTRDPSVASRTLKLTVNGTSIKVDVDGTNVISVTDSGLAAAGRTGVYCDFTDDLSSTLDNFSGDGLGPTIDTQPANATAWEGQTASFSVSATASAGSLSYQWQRDDGGGFSDIGGATSNSYTTPSLTYSADNADRYRVNVTDSNGTIASNNATLTVLMTGKPYYLKA